MQKINFENNVTKANADTFNTLQNNIERAINKGIITCNVPQTKLPETTTTDYYKLAWVGTPIGEGLTISDNEVIIGENVHHVKISFTGSCHATSGSHSLGMRLYKNKTSHSTFCLITTQGSQDQILTIANRVIDVQPGDTLNVRLWGAKDDTIYQNGSYFTVEVVD